MPALAVLGMHRSYTSLAARWLVECGVDMGESTLPEGIGNEEGHFEDVDFLNFHISILRDHGLAGSGIAQLGGIQFEAEAYRNMTVKGARKDEGEALIDRKLARSSSFGWKDPRTCLFLPFYREALDPFSLILFRPLNKVVASLLAREQRVLNEKMFFGFRRPAYWLGRSRWDERLEQICVSYVEAWLHYNECLLQHVEATEPDRRMVHDLASLLVHDEAIVGQLQRWGFACGKASLREMFHDRSVREFAGLSHAQEQRTHEINARFAELIGS